MGKGESKSRIESEKKKKGREPKAVLNDDSESDNFYYDPDDVHEPTYRPQAPARSKSKRKSAQNAELRFRENNSDDDDLLMKRYSENEEKKAALASTLESNEDIDAKPETDGKSDEILKEKEETSEQLPADLT